MEIEVVYGEALGNDVLLAQWLEKLPEGFRLDLKKYAHPRRALPTVLGRLMVADYLSRNGLEPEVWSVGTHGKPLPQSGIYFSISHSKGAVAVAFARHELGLDIEKIRIPGSAHQAYRRFFSSAELNYIGQDDKRFFELWTRKEALIKADGRGLSLPVAQLEVLGAGAQVDDRYWYWTEVKIWAGFFVHLATLWPQPSIKTRNFFP